MNPVTIILTTHTRLNNAKTILETLRKQRLKPTLFLWDNSEAEWDCGTVDWSIRSTPNTMVSGRWWMIAQAESDYVISIDDDICPTDDLMTEKIVNFLEAHPDSLIGPEGVLLKKDGEYRYSQGIHLLAGTVRETTRVDVVKSRLIAFTPKVLRMANIAHWRVAEPPNMDDLQLNTLFAQKVIPNLFYHRIRELPTGRESLWCQSDHFRLRDKFVKKYF
ncbi:MAG: hypothetical protein FWH27_14510 [Planctomycetaceae bacterium]|nr:hypothetical protein [Planctomycetaceae bacterium]